jgi:lysophospholipase L1-like esterase
MSGCAWAPAQDTPAQDFPESAPPHSALTPTDRLAEDGTLPAEIMPDHLQLSARGYRLWAEAMEPSVEALLGER